jgi:hypothetical protein
LVNSTSEVSSKTSLYTALVHGNESKSRKEIYDFIREMYDIRSKVVHGDIESIKRKLKKGKLSSDYIRLKVIVSDILIKIFGKERKNIEEKIREHIFTCGILTL